MCWVFCFFFFKWFHLFIFGCAGSWLLHRVSLVAELGLPSSCDHGLLITRAFLTVEQWALGHSGFSSCSIRAQQLWCTGSADPQHVGSSWIRDRTHVSCIGRQILYHWTTREALLLCFESSLYGLGTSSFIATAAAKSLQSCPTLCDPIDGSPPGSPVPGILQARTLEWVAISFSNMRKWKVKVKSLSRVRLLATPWTRSLPGSSIHGILQARVLEWGAIAFSEFFY